jgi:hypothetical protein
MQRRFKLVSAGIIVAAILLAGTVVFRSRLFREMRNGAHDSCLASVKAAVQVIVATNGVLLMNVPPGVERLLTPTEVASILRLSRSLDCARFRDGHPVDAWGHPFCVRVTNNTQWGLPATAFSAGPDGKPGTGDDIHCA